MEGDDAVGKGSIVVASVAVTERYDDDDDAQDRKKPRETAKVGRNETEANEKE
jgi:hypothetical protein